jgi:uroporphyrinogen decarboxylase
MLSRRQFFLSAALPMAARAAAITPKERVDRVLKGQDTDRFPYTCWYHFLDEQQPGKVHAANTLNFHRKFRTDVVKVMSDYAYPKSKGQWYELKADQNPFPEQLKALDVIGGELKGKVHFVETLFNPYKVAEKLSSDVEVKRLMKEKPQALLDALEAIAKSQASHARKAMAAGASGVFLAIANANDGINTPPEYAKFSEPFDRMVLDAVGDAPMNTLHIHGDKVYLDRFYKGWRATVLNYSSHATNIPIARARGSFAEVIMGGLDERNFRTLTHLPMKRMILNTDAGRKYIVSPGCSVPNDTKDEEILRVAQIVGA